MIEKFPENLGNILEKTPEIIYNNSRIICGNYLEKSLENVGKNPDKFPENSEDNFRKNVEKSVEISRKNAEKSPELSQKITEKTLEKVEKMVVKKPENSSQYDVNTLEYCCRILKHLVIGDGRAIKLNANGLVLVNNPDNPVFRLKFCPNCGTEIEQPSDNFVEKSVPEPKEILRDNMAKRPPN